MRLAALALLTSLLAAAPASAETLSVESGPLRAVVETDPWTLTFTGASGRSLLASPAGQGIGVRGPAGWDRVARARSAAKDGDAVVAEVETAGPAGQTLTVRIEPDSSGVIAVEVSGVSGGSAVGALWRARGSERFYGLGERATSVEHRGEVVENYVADGPYDHGPERVGLIPFIPAPGYRQRDDATYFPIPWVLSSEGFGLLVDNTETSYHRFDDAAGWSFEVTTAPEGVATPQEAPETMRFRVFEGATPSELLRRFTETVGRQPPIAAPWVLGPWFQPGGSLEDQLGQIQKLQAADAPVSVAQTYLHYLPCGDQVGREQSERQRVEAVHARGLAITSYFNPMICTSYQPEFDEAEAQGALIKRADGSTYEYRYTSSPDPEDWFDVSQFDFTAASGRSFYAGLLAEAVHHGHDGWMEDFGEYTPLDAHFADGTTGVQTHNPYVTQYHCAAYDYVSGLERPVVRFQRSGWTGSAPCAQVVWSGDPTVDWGFDGLASQVKAGLGMGLSGISTWGSDIGGFFALGNENKLTPELLKRWVQFGAVSPVMRMQRNGVALPPKDRPQVEDDDQIGNWRRYAKLHTRLFPYIEAAARTYRQSGLPIMRHLTLAYPEDERSADREDEYLFGPDLLAAPVLEPGAVERELYLPPGQWIDFWRALRYREKAGDLRLRRARLLHGRREATVPAPLEELPLMVRAGAVLPLLPADVDTLSSYRPPKGIVPLSKRRGRLDLIAFPRGRWNGSFHRREALRSRERRGGWKLHVRGKRKRRYALQASLATLRRPFKPCSVTVGRAPRPFSYSKRTRVLRVKFAARTTTVTVKAC